jgi:hypothetical protein
MDCTLVHCGELRPTFQMLTKSRMKTFLLAFVRRTWPTKFTSTIPDSENAKCGGVSHTKSSTPTLVFLYLIWALYVMQKLYPRLRSR